MTEKRMICTLDPDVIGRNLFWKPVEPAPPKDWRPFCFTSACKRGESHGIMSMDKEPCLSCPYRLQAQNGQVKE